MFELLEEHLIPNTLSISRWEKAKQGLASFLQLNN